MIRFLVTVEDLVLDQVHNTIKHKYIRIKINKMSSQRAFQFLL